MTNLQITNYFRRKSGKPLLLSCALSGKAHDLSFLAWSKISPVFLLIFSRQNILQKTDYSVDHRKNLIYPISSKLKHAPKTVQAIEETMNRYTATGIHKFIYPIGKVTFDLRDVTDPIDITFQAGSIRDLFVKIGKFYDVKYSDFEVDGNDIIVTETVTDDEARATECQIEEAEQGMRHLWNIQYYFSIGETVTPAEEGIVIELSNLQKEEKKFLQPNI